MLIVATLYLCGLACLLATFLPFSPLTIDLINLKRETQLAIYRRRHLLWAMTGAAWGLALACSLLAVGPATLIGITGVSMALMFWTGYVPVVMTPPGHTQRIPAADASRRIAADDVVLGIALNGESCAYLRDQIARPHYLVDRVGGRELVVSYCILCNSATAFEAQLDGQPLDLRCVTAYNNNIIYLDPASGNFIQQIDAQVISGPATGSRLATVPVIVGRWADWLALHPDTSFLDAPPLTLRDRLVALMLEALIPIRKLARRERPWHRIRGRLDTRMNAMQFVIGVELNGDAAAYDPAAIRRNGIIEDTVGGTALALFGARDTELVSVFERKLGDELLHFEAVSPNDGLHHSIVARDRETGSHWTLSGLAIDGPLRDSQLNAVPHFNQVFWFSWALFKPHVRLYSAPSA